MSDSFHRKRSSGRRARAASSGFSVGCQGFLRDSLLRTAVFMSGSSQATALAGLSSEQRQVGGLVVITCYNNVMTMTYNVELFETYQTRLIENRPSMLRERQTELKT